MSRPRKKLFGPLLYSTIVLSVIAIVITKGLEFQARSSMGATSSRPVSEIMAALRSGDELARGRAFDDLHRGGLLAAMPVWIEATKLDDAFVRKTACEALVHMRADPALLLPVLVDLADDPVPEVRIEAARGLGHLRDFTARTALYDPKKSATPDEASLAAAFAWLHALAKDKDPAVRFAGVRALLTLGGPADLEIAQVVLEAASDADMGEGRQELAALVKRHRPDLVVPILPRLVSLLALDDPVILFTTIDALAELGPAARPILATLVERGNSGEPYLRAAARIACAAIEGPGTPESSATLAQIVADDTLPFDRRQVALAQLREKDSAALVKATPGLIRGLTNPDATIRQETLNLLQDITMEHPAELPSVFQNP